MSPRDQGDIEVVVPKDTIDNPQSKGCLGHCGCPEVGFQKPQLERIMGVVPQCFGYSEGQTPKQIES